MPKHAQQLAIIFSWLMPWLWAMWGLRALPLYFLGKQLWWFKLLCPQLQSEQAQPSGACSTTPSFFAAGRPWCWYTAHSCLFYGWARQKGKICQQSPDSQKHGSWHTQPGSLNLPVWTARATLVCSWSPVLFFQTNGFLPVGRSPSTLETTLFPGLLRRPEDERSTKSIQKSPRC